MHISNEAPSHRTPAARPRTPTPAAAPAPCARGSQAPAAASPGRGKYLLDLENICMVRAEHLAAPAALCVQVDEVGPGVEQVPLRLPAVHHHLTNQR